MHVVAPKASPDKISNKKTTNENSHASVLIVSWWNTDPPGEILSMSMRTLLDRVN